MRVRNGNLLAFSDCKRRLQKDRRGKKILYAIHMWPVRHFPIMLVKLAFYAPSNSRFYAPKMLKYARFSK